MVITCECGFVARGAGEGEVIDVIREHMRTDHPDLLTAVTRADLLGWMEED